MNKYVLFAVIALVVAAGGFLLLQNKASSPAVVAPTPTAIPAVSPSPSPSATSSATKEIMVQNKGFTFDPSEIRVKKGNTVTITFKNTGGMHDFVIDEFNVATKQLQKDQQDSVTFTADKTGSFEYYCSVSNHKALGMKGMLIVE